MADVMDLPPEAPLMRDDKRRDRISDRKDNERRKDRDLRDRRDDRDDRFPRRDYYDRRSEDRDYKRRRTPSLSPPPLYGHRDRDRRGSPSRRSPTYKRSRRDEDYGRGSPDKRMVSGRGKYWQDSGRGGEGLMTYKQFITELEDDISPTEAERRYAEYKSEFISTQKKTFFEQNKGEDWLRDKYDPSRLEASIQRRNESCKVAARDFMTELESGSLDTSPSIVGQDSREGQEASDEEMDDRRRRSGRGSAKDHDSSAPKAPSISSDPRRIEKDIEQGRALIKKLDSEKGIERNVLITSELDKSEGERALGGGGMMNPIVIIRSANHVKGYEGVELLDVMLTYLWRVHYVDYYGTKEYKEQPKVLRHVRGEGKGVEDAALSSEWEKKLDDTWQARLQGQDPLEMMMAKDKTESAMTQGLEPLIRKIKDEKYGWKYGCGAKNCTKLFHGPEFVQKHLKLKHQELVTELAVKVYEDLYFENYMSDPDAPGSTPVMASQRDRPRRPPRPDEAGRNAGRGGGRGRENEKGREDGGFDRDNEGSPSQDYQAGGPFDSAGPFDGARGDSAMFDPFGGPALRGPPPFGADMGVPPVLMPVPGAGPLGPFVPAPPEVAMRLWREQGGAGPFHPGVFEGPFEGEGGGSRNNNRKRSGGGGRGGAGLIDAPPMILPGPNVRHDSRRALRSYRDLDAPEDEVTVIDYRSL